MSRESQYGEVPKDAIELVFHRDNWACGYQYRIVSHASVGGSNVLWHGTYFDDETDEDERKDLMEEVERACKRYGIPFNDQWHPYDEDFVRVPINEANWNFVKTAVREMEGYKRPTDDWDIRSYHTATALALANIMSEIGYPAPHSVYPPHSETDGITFEWGEKNNGLWAELEAEFMVNPVLWVIDDRNDKDPHKTERFYEVEFNELLFSCDYDIFNLREASSP